MIRIEKLNYSVGHKQILHDINLQVRDGDFQLIFGPNGAGKTTLLKILCGQIRHYDGTVLLDGRPIKEFTIRQLAAFVSYQPQFDDFTMPIAIKDILLAGRYPYKSFFKSYSKEDYRIYNRVVEELELQSFLDRDITTLSGGEKKKVMLASAFIQDVSIIIFDEPFTFLDPEAVVNLKRMMTRLNQMGKTLLVVSHHFETLFPIVNKITALKNGRVVYSGDKTFDPTILKETFNADFQRIHHNGREIIFLND